MSDLSFGNDKSNKLSGGNVMKRSTKYCTLIFKMATSGRQQRWIPSGFSLLFH